MQVGGITGNYNLLSTQGSRKGCYYNTLNTYYNTGYWPDEYRFGIVFIYDNNLLSQVFNVQGIDFSLLNPNDDVSKIMIPEVKRTESDLNTKPDPYENEPSDYIFNKQYMTNSKGVIKFNKYSLISGMLKTYLHQKLQVLNLI